MQENDNKDILVSILMVTYNHETHIAQALDSILIQDVNFKYKIIIGEDCSTDNTRHILLEYKEKYPDKIQLLLHKKNIGAMNNWLAVIKASSSKYNAILEGDDYWIDRNKLQTQIDLMEDNPECNMSFHAAEKHTKDKYLGLYAKYKEGNKIFSTSEVILAGGGLCPSASIVFNKKVISILPDFYNDVPVGDYFLQIFGSLNGGILYIDKVMSVYRQGVLESSWTFQMNDITKKEKFILSMIKSLEELDKYLKKKYKNEIKQVKSYYFFEMAFSYLKNNMFIDFKENIELSYNLYKIKLNQFIIYPLRSFPRVIKIFVRIKNVLYFK